MKAALLLCLMAGAAAAHGTGEHAVSVGGVVAQSPVAEAVDPFPIALGGPYRLIDQRGQTRTEADPAGHLQLLFFGYANCQEICSATLPQMAEVAVDLSARGIAVTPVMITVDPERDTAAAMDFGLGKYSDDFIGLTGDAAALAQAYSAFSVDIRQLFEAPTGPVYAHGGLIYLLDGNGKVLTLIPPILSNGQVVDLVASYAGKG